MTSLSYWLRNMVPARIWLRPPAEVRNPKGCRNYRSTIYRKAFGILTKAAQGRAVYPRDIDRTRRSPALKARRLSKVGGAQEEGGVEIGGKSWIPAKSSPARPIHLKSMETTPATPGDPVCRWTSFVQGPQRFGVLCGWERTRL